MPRYLIKTIFIPDNVKEGSDFLIETGWLLVDPGKIDTISVFDKKYILPVRCKDCKFYKQLDDACPYLGEDGYYKELPGKDDFCSRGERRDDI